MKGGTQDEKSRINSVGLRRRNSGKSRSGKQKAKQYRKQYRQEAHHISIDVEMFNGLAPVYHKIPKPCKTRSKKYQLIKHGG